MNIRTISIKQILICIVLLLGSMAKAQQSESKPHKHKEGEECGLIRNPDYERLMKRLGESELRAFPSRISEGDLLPVIHKNSHTFKLRLAVGITKASFAEGPFWGDATKVEPFLKGMEEYLNSVYLRDCGVQFEVLRNDKLLFTRSSDKYVYEEDEGSQLFNELLGQENYDIGIIIRPASGHLAGLAVLGGVTDHSTKGYARATINYSTVAHELGHLMGAEHTHTKADAIFVEPEEGQSIMSYGYPRTFFALASVKSIRATLSYLSYYKDAQRTQLVQGIAGTNKIGIIPFEGEHPKLNRAKLKKEYKVPYGTFFQFRIPTTNEHRQGFLYVAHPFDISKSYIQYANLLQPSYPGSEDPLCMFHPRYIPPKSNSREAQLYTHSDHFNTGIYTYVLSAFNRGHHDTFTTKLNIVGGVPTFKIKKVDGIGRLTDVATAGSPITVSWEPCTQLYGPKSKVRISLSDDFGQTFKHVLADEVPNNGTWTGSWPYLNINRKSYPNYIAGYGSSSIGDVRAGVIKVEVLGEAAYSLSHHEAYRMQGAEIIRTGGFYLRIEDGKSLIFKRANGDAPPKQYVEVQQASEIPPMEALKASLGSRSQNVACSEMRNGNIITRKWAGNVGGKQSTYTQLIKVLGEGADIPEYMIELSGIDEMCKDLYQHIGHLAYPKAELAESDKFCKAYNEVYDSQGEVKPTTTSEQVKALSHALKEIGGIRDIDIVMPISGSKYKIASYHKTFRGEKYHYLSPNTLGQDAETTTPNRDKAAEWLLQDLDGIYRITSGGQSLKLSGLLRGYNGVRLVRGFTWGTFGIISQDKNRIAQINSEGDVISFNEHYQVDTIGMRINQPGIVVSTDFRFEPIDEGYDVYFVAKTWTSLSATLVGSGKPTLVVTKEGDRRYKVRIPKGYSKEQIIFEGEGGRQTKAIRLIGRSATYNEEGRRTHSLTIGDSHYGTLYLDYPTTIPSGVRAFTATASSTGDNNNNTKVYHLKLKEVKAVIPAQTAVILYGDQPDTYEFAEAKEQGLEVLDNVLVGSTEEVAPTALDDNYLYFDLSKPSGTASSLGQTLSYTKLSSGVGIVANTAYYRLYKYGKSDGSDSNYNVTTTKLSTDEFGKKATDTPPASKPEEPKEPKPEPTPAPAPEPPTPPTPPTPDPQPNPPTPVEPPVSPTPPTPTPPVDPAPAPTPTPDPVEPTPPAPTPDPVPPTDPKDGAGDSDVDGSGDEDNTPDPNGSVDGQPNVPIGEDGTIDRPYSARSITSLEMGGKAIWLRGRVLGWLTSDGRLQSKPTESIALGEDSNTYVPVFIPKAYRMQVQSLSTQALLVEGVISDYSRGRGISDKGFRSLRAEGVVFAPNATTTDSPEASEVSPYDYTGYIYDLSGRIVGKGNFASLPRGIYILGGKKYIKR